MHFRTLRFDQDSPILPPELSKILDSYFSGDKRYYLQHETSDKTGKLHFQGWLQSTVAAEYKPLRDLLKSLYGESKYSYGKRNKESYFSYIVKNPSKSDVQTVYTNYSPEELEALNIKEWIPGKSALARSDNKLRVFLDWFENSYKAEPVVKSKINYLSLSEAIIIYHSENFLLLDDRLHKKYFISVSIILEQKHDTHPFVSMDLYLGKISSSTWLTDFLRKNSGKFFV